MPNAQVQLIPDTVLDDTLDAVMEEMGVPHGFGSDVLAAAEVSAARGPQVPPGGDRSVGDELDLPLVTIDPPGSRDLDQAYTASRQPGGYRVSYAIADVGAFVVPGDPVDLEAHRRGLTTYLPGRRASLHPEILSQGAASLLPGVDRQALLWTIDLDRDGRVSGTPSFRRALVRSRHQFTYAEVQTRIDDGTAEEPLALLREIGDLRHRLEEARGGISLRLPTQAVAIGESGARLHFERPLAVEGWNAQISLLTGIVAAGQMLQGGIGVLRTIPEPDPRDLERFRRSAKALGRPWPGNTTYPTFVRSLDPADPEDAALLVLAARTLRGAGSTVFDGDVPELTTHAAVASTYAHVTAPLRRMADRYANEILLALHHDHPVPDWVRSALPRLPEEMAGAYRKERSVERAVLDAVEALLLASRIGEEFDASVVSDEGKGRVTIQLLDPAVVAQLRSARSNGGPTTAPEIGATIRVRLTVADPTTRTVTFVPADG